MNNQITAKEAYVIASGEYEKEMKKKIEENLCSIYSKIRSAIENGRMGIDIDLGFVESKYQERLYSHLNEKGFKTSFYSDDYDGGHFISISWRHIENEQ